MVDLRGPAYKCSCPSRKFPCKHALGLLVEWSEGRVPSRGRAGRLRGRVVVAPRGEGREHRRKR
nr:SWIM zinc finger family protein [Rhodococcus erythropolis]